jgi:hypothetical protein
VGNKWSELVKIIKCNQYNNGNTRNEKELLRKTFGDNLPLLKLLRKVFLPEITADAPLGQNIDLWMSVRIEDVMPEQALINLKARNILIQHIETQLQALNALSQPEPTAEEVKEINKKNSSK